MTQVFAPDAPAPRPPAGPAVRGWAARRPGRAALVALVALVLAVRLVWGWGTSRRLDAAIEDVRRVGHPTRGDEVVFEPLPDRENAWAVFMRAHGGIKPGVDSPRSSILEYPSYPPYGPEWEQVASESEAENADAFRIARTARPLARAQTRQGVASANTAAAPGLNTVRHLANILADGAAYRHLRGDDREAVERLRDVLHLAASLRQDPFLISQLVAIGIDALACDAAQQIAPTLRLDPGDPKSATAGQVRGIIDALLDERAVRANFTRSLVVERAMTLDVLRDEAAPTWAIRPFADHAARRRLEEFELLIPASEQPTRAATQTILDRMPRRPQDEDPLPGLLLLGRPAAPKPVPRYSRWFESYSAASLDRSIEQLFRVTAEKRATAVALAARLYRHDKGRWPPDLSALAGEYLPHVPADPFAADGRPLGYLVRRGALPDGGDRPLVYFDPAGSVDVGVDSEPMYGWRSDLRAVPPRRSIRQYRDLALWAPKTRRFDEYREEQRRLEAELEAEAVEDEPEEPGAPGDDAEQDGPADGPADQ